MKHVTSLGMTTGMTTNGFLLTEDKLLELIDAGMGRIQMSVDALKPKEGVPKSLKTLRKKIEMVSRHPIWFRVNTVICDETIDEVEEVAKTCWDLGVAINFSVVHDRGRLQAGRRTPRASSSACSGNSRIRSHTAKPISTRRSHLIDYYDERARSSEMPMDWTCQGGNKCFYVSAEGHFQYCYHVPSTTQLMDVNAQRPRQQSRQEGLRGESACVDHGGIHTSLPFSNRGELVKLEVKRRAAATSSAVSRFGQQARWRWCACASGPRVQEYAPVRFSSVPRHRGSSRGLTVLRADESGRQDERCQVRQIASLDFALREAEG